MFSRWVKNHSPKKFCTNSRTFRDFLGLFPDFLGQNKNFLGRKRNFVRLNLKNVPWNRTNNVLFHQNYTLFLLKKAQITRKHSKYLKYSQNLYFQTLWESHNSQQLFLNSDMDVKWRNRGRENIPNRSLDSEQSLFDCWADAWLWVRSRSGLHRERTRNMMPTRKKERHSFGECRSKYVFLMWGFECLCTLT